MMTFLVENIGTIFVGVLVLAVLAVIVRSLVRNRRQGVCSGCSGCNGRDVRPACAADRRSGT